MNNLFSDRAFLMGTQVEVKIIGDFSTVEYTNLLRESLNFFYKAVAKLSRFDDSSELSILNLNSGNKQQVSNELFALIKIGIELGEATNGLFDITIGDVLEKYGYKKEVNIVEIDKQEMGKYINNRPNYKNIILNEESSEIFCDKGISIDLGSFGKGYAINLAKDYLISKGVENFLINAGGDVCANGNNQKGEIWKTLLFKPESPHESRLYPLENSSIASSGYWGRKYKKFNHIINPQTGQPSFVGTVFVESGNPMIADLMATIAYLNPPNISEILEKYSAKQI